MTQSFEEFRLAIAMEFGWDKDVLTTQTLLIQDCLLDSLGMYEVLLFVEEMGTAVDEERLLTWETLGDVYETINNGT